MSKPIILSGVKPTNYLQLGNYLGAIRQWVQLQEKYTCYFPVVDLHAITARQDPGELREASYLAAAAYLACGLDPKDNCLFIQSHVKAHSALSWILTCFSYMGELNRMTQYKEKSQKEGTNISAGLFSYPILMAADIFMYDANLVPVGEDQKQHIEIARNIAQRVNSFVNKEVIVIPEPFIPKAGGRIMDLQNPENKMSKSAETELGTIFLLDSPKDIEKKFKRAVTDSGTEILYKDDKPGVKNLLEIQMCITGKPIADLEESYKGKQYGHLKVDTANLVIAELEPIQNAMRKYLDDRGELENLLRKGAAKAREKANATYERIHDAIGFIPTL
ncbi:MAG: tryptophan--tRNA ligase [Oligoflexales bacterium]